MKALILIALLMSGATAEEARWWYDNEAEYPGAISSYCVVKFWSLSECTVDSAHVYIQESTLTQLISIGLTTSPDILPSSFIDVPAYTEAIYDPNVDAYYIAVDLGWEIEMHEWFYCVSHTHDVVDILRGTSPARNHTYPAFCAPLPYEQNIILFGTGMESVAIERSSWGSIKVIL